MKLQKPTAWEILLVYNYHRFTLLYYYHECFLFQVMILTFVVSSSVNVIIALQVLYYWNTTKEVLEVEETIVVPNTNYVLMYVQLCRLKMTPLLSKHY